MLEIAQQVILLADHTKIGKVAFAKFADLSDIDVCIIDDKAPQDVMEKLKEAGIRICMVTP